MKKLIMKSLSLPLIMAALMTNTACASKEMTSYVKDYQDRDQASAVSTVPEESLNNFIQLFSDLHTDQLQARVEKVYADDLYFNDTLNTIERRSELLKYLKHTADNLDEYQFTVSDIAQSKDNVYIRWVMDVKFTAAGKDIRSRSVGMSHLKFNDQGQVILHQDFWDSVEGIYQHLPYVGYLFRKVRDKL